MFDCKGPLTGLQIPTFCVLSEEVMMLSPCHHLTLIIPEQPNLCHSHIGQSFKMICGGHQRSVHTANQRATPLPFLYTLTQTLKMFRQVSLTKWAFYSANVIDHLKTNKIDLKITPRILGHVVPVSGTACFFDLCQG